MLWLREYNKNKFKFKVKIIYLRARTQIIIQWDHRIVVGNRNEFEDVYTHKNVTQKAINNKRYLKIWYYTYTWVSESYALSALTAMICLQLWVIPDAIYAILGVFYGSRAPAVTRWPDLGLVSVRLLANPPPAVHGTPRKRPNVFILASLPSSSHNVRAVTSQAVTH